MTNVILLLISLAVVYAAFTAARVAFDRSSDVRYYLRLAGYVYAVTISCCVGLTVGPVMYLLGRPGTTNFMVARTMAFLGPLLTGVRVRVEGADILATTNVPAVFVANHQSSLDILCLGHVFPDKVVVMAKKSIKFVPLMGWFMALANNVFVDRSNRGSAIETMATVAVFLKKHEYGLWLFPEGTRSHQTDDSILPFKKGAFHLAVQGHIPIVPIVFSTYKPCWDPKTRTFEAGTITVKVLEPIVTTGMTVADVDTLLDRTRLNMLAALQTIKTVRASDQVKTKKQY
ncbi:1-acylglycerol-3-phosphate O-acyltransferase [Geranomyces variabilis]|uniref:1-acyl-sn-glycerol-3-phosphate acyltransferase n=1 Tax=Geranomyces variabilis TaxID=109894 RepID=A0AAD5TIJ1_9FUNG|nr:1-acylglycerol-3-phosphate O-acyltransferase [Geranomyces variabilis]